MELSSSLLLAPSLRSPSNLLLRILLFLLLWPNASVCRCPGALAWLKPELIRTHVETNVPRKLTVTARTIFPPPHKAQMVSEGESQGRHLDTGDRFTRKHDRRGLKGQLRMPCILDRQRHLPRTLRVRSASRYLPPNTTAKLYLYYVRPCFEYASPVWHGATPASAAQSLERLQASMARTILRAEWTTPKKELLAALQWPSLRWRRAIASLMLFHRLKNSPTPVASLCLPAPFASDNSRSRRRQHQIRLPSTRSTRYTRSFFFHSALLWNSLPNSIQSHSSTSSFQHALEEHWHAYKYLTDTDIPLPPV